MSLVHIGPKANELCQKAPITHMINVPAISAFQEIFVMMWRTSERRPIERIIKYDISIASLPHCGRASY